MIKYHKIQTVYKRDPDTKYKTLLEGNFSTPELEYLKDNLWGYTEKVDGTNIRVMSKNQVILFGGKTDRAQLPAPLVQRLTERFFIPDRLDNFMKVFNGEDVCLYGEGYGAKIQKGGVYRPDQDFILFDVKIEDWWLHRSDVLDVGRLLDLDVVPLIRYGTLYDMIEMTRKGFKSAWGDFTAEGIVARPEVELKTRSGNRIITKIKHKDFIGG